MESHGQALEEWQSLLDSEAPAIRQVVACLAAMLQAPKNIVRRLTIPMAPQRATYLLTELMGVAWLSTRHSPQWIMIKQGLILF